MRKDPKQLYKQPVKVDLDDDLRGKVERFAVVRKNSPKKREGSDSLGRKQQAQKYSQYVNEINRKSSISKSPTRQRTPKSRFDAEAYKKQF